MKWAIENGTSTFFGRKSLFKNHDDIYIYFVYIFYIYNAFLPTESKPFQRLCCILNPTLQDKGWGVVNIQPGILPFSYIWSLAILIVSRVLPIYCCSIYIYSPHSQELCDEINKAQQEKVCSHESLEARIRLGYIWVCGVNSYRVRDLILRSCMHSC
jgi:hypothetical protein